MEYTEGTLKTDGQDIIYPQEYEQASNSYLMAIVGIVAGLPLPIVNIIASFLYYLSKRRSSYFVRWHCIQSILAQAVIIPFNSIAFGWTLSKIIFLISLRNESESFSAYTGRHYNNNAFEGGWPFEDLYYWLYIFFVILLNIAEFIAVLYTSSRVRNGNNIRLGLLANITDRLCSKENRDPYRI